MIDIDIIQLQVTEKIKSGISLYISHQRLMLKHAEHYNH